MSNERDERLDRLRSAADTWLEPEDPEQQTDALIETAVLMAAADGEIAEPELQHLVTTVWYTTSTQADEAHVRAMVAELMRRLHEDGWEARIASVAFRLRDPELRRNAYRLAAGVSFVDGEVQPDEERLFALLARAFEIPTDEASRLLTEVRDALFGRPASTPPRYSTPPYGTPVPRRR